jgi:hypothetical protein
MIRFFSTTDDTLVSYNISVEEVSDFILYVGTKNLALAIELANKKQWCTPQDREKIVLAKIANPDWVDGRKKEPIGSYEMIADVYKEEIRCWVKVPLGTGSWMVVNGTTGKTVAVGDCAVSAATEFMNLYRGKVGLPLLKEQ